jgi:hypothetical protein
MDVLNIHERTLRFPHQQVGALIDSLSSPTDALWPKYLWPRMGFDRPLSLGAVGGHGPIRYFVEEYSPGRSIKFRFTSPAGFNGFHGYEVVGTSHHESLLRHTLRMTTSGRAVLSWPWVFRPLHDALMEDSLAMAEASLGQNPQFKAWSPWVKFLRWLASGGRARKQGLPHRPTTAASLTGIRK